MTKRRSRPFRSNPEMWVPSTEGHFFYQDFRTHIVPYRHRPKAYQLSAEGVPSHRVEQSLLPHKNGRSVSDFIREVALSLLTRHEVWLEVSFDDANGDHSPFSVFEVHGVRQTASGTLIQYLPSREELPPWSSEKETWEREVELDLHQMIHVLLPDAYPSKVLVKVMHDLAAINPEPLPDFVMQLYSGQRSNIPAFDVNEAARTRRLRTIQAARPVGWTAREIFLWPNSVVSDFYRNLGELRFLHFCSSMRERAEEALLKVLTLAGDRCNFTTSVTANGIHTPKEVEGLIGKFEAGELSFFAVNDIIFENVKDAQSVQRLVT